MQAAEAWRAASGHLEALELVVLCEGIVGKLLADEGLGLRHLAKARVSLEDAFMKLTKGLVQ